jgi:hypothetical protein
VKLIVLKKREKKDIKIKFLQDLKMRENMKVFLLW